MGEFARAKNVTICCRFIRTRDPASHQSRQFDVSIEWFIGMPSWRHARRGGVMRRWNRKSAGQESIILAAILSIGVVPSFAKTDTEMGANGINGANGSGAISGGQNGTAATGATANANSTDATNTATSSA